MLICSKGKLVLLVLLLVLLLILILGGSQCCFLSMPDGLPCGISVAPRRFAPYEGLGCPCLSRFVFKRRR